MTARFSGRGLGAALIGILDRISRPHNRRGSRVDRKKRLGAIEFIANELSTALFFLAAGGLALIMALVLVPSSAWDSFDEAVRTAYWRPFFAKIERFERALQGRDESRIETEARSFFELAREVRPRDHGEAGYLRALERALSAAPPAIRLRAAEVGVGVSPNDSFFWYRLGVERWTAGQVVPGTEALQKAFQLRPYSHQVFVALVRALEQTGNEDAIRRVRAEYVSGVESAAGKRAAVQVRYLQPDGVRKVDLLRLDACSPVRLALQDSGGALLKGILFPPVDGLHVSVNQEKSLIINKVQYFRAKPAGGFVSTIEPGDPFMATPALSVEGGSEESMQIEFCVRSRGAA